MSGVADVNERTGRLVELLEQQRECYRGLKRLAEKQRRLIADEDPEALLKILAERQRLVDQLGELNKSLQPYRQEWANTYTQMKSERRQYVQQVLDEINTLLGSIMLTDAEDSRMLSASKANVRNRIQEATSGRMANSAYATQAYRASRTATADHEA
ncbi:MAG: flagellar export chaperone FlgN [Phycisphaerae bacterium]|nr:flagellar export chaperone FlgN [Phycisphaerae bacterium]